ncbi:hypothetical protein [Ruminococcus sp.]|uniref:hypothetical protein n=1 Tax=Ruminococcus sp. TaxID=41978 RepID=UPI00388E3C85
MTESADDLSFDSPFGCHITAMTFPIIASRYRMAAKGTRAVYALVYAWFTSGLQQKA